MKSFFITGTGTGVGKTLVTAALAHQLNAQGKKTVALKPIISGFDKERAEESDTGELIAAQGLKLSDRTLGEISPWRFAAPLAPSLAAADEGAAIEFELVTRFCLKPRPADFLLIEGAGGAMTPLAPGRTILDLADALGSPVILVCGSYLGALSHTLTAAEAMVNAGLTIATVVISESADSCMTLARTHECLLEFLPERTRVVTIARLDSCAQLWKYAPDLTSIVA